jgi:formyltetrahydrofolate deformylase
MAVTLLKLACPDRVGLLARITNFVAFHGGNLLEVNQFTDPVSGWFFARMAIDSKTLALDLPAFRKAFQPTADELNATWSIRDDDAKMRICSGAGNRGNCPSRSRW